MHHLMLVTVALAPDATSDDVRRQVENDLLIDASFCGDGGRFGAPLCDWFVIGGRWSGLLAETMIGDAHKAAVIAKFPELDKEWWPESFAASHAEELDAIWREQGGTGPSTYTRDGYGSFADDAMLITPRLYEALLSNYEGEDRHGGEFVDLDVEPLQPDFVGRKWLVVVDYHN